MALRLGKNNAQKVKYVIIKAGNIKKIQDTFFCKILKIQLDAQKKYCQYKVLWYFADTLETGNVTLHHEPRDGWCEAPLFPWDVRSDRREQVVLRGWVARYRCSNKWCNAIILANFSKFCKK